MCKVLLQVLFQCVKELARGLEISMQAVEKLYIVERKLHPAA